MRYKRDIFPFLVIVCIFIALIVITRQFIADERIEISCDTPQKEQGTSFEMVNGFSPISFMTRGVHHFFH